MTPIYKTKLGLKPRSINVGTQKIDGSALKIHNITLARFSLQDSQERVWFFEKIFLLANINMEVVLRMFF